MTAALNADVWIGPDTLLHLRSAPDGGRNKDLEQSSFLFAEWRLRAL